MPNPRKGESRKDWMPRCISAKIKEGKHPNTPEGRKAAAGECGGIYDNKKRKSSNSNITLYEEGMNVEEDRFYAFKFDADFYKETNINSELSFSEQLTKDGYKATILIGNRFMKGVYVDMKEIENTYKQWNNTLHDMNHMGSGYRIGFSIVPSDISYIVGYQNNASYNKTTNEVIVDVHIDEKSIRFNEWKSYVDICESANKIPNVSMYCFGKLEIKKAKDLPKDSHYKKNGYKADDLVPCMTNVIPYMVSTVTRGACNDKDGCGIKHSNGEECNCESCKVSVTEQKIEINNPEIAKRKAYLVNRLKNLRGKVTKNV